jgi:hypothetical protein
MLQVVSEQIAGYVAKADDIEQLGDIFHSIGKMSHVDAFNKAQAVYDEAFQRFVRRDTRPVLVQLLRGRPYSNRGYQPYKGFGCHVQVSYNN